LPAEAKGSRDAGSIAPSHGTRASSRRPRKSPAFPTLRPAEEKIEKKIVYYRKLSYDWKIAASECLPGDAAGGFDSRLRNGPETPEPRKENLS
jgi:hypothetical protein